MKIQHGWVAKVEFFHKRKSKRACISREQKRKDISVIYTALGYPLEEIPQATRKAMDFQLIGTFKPGKPWALKKQKQLW